MACLGPNFFSAAAGVNRSGILKRKVAPRRGFPVEKTESGSINELRIYKLSDKQFRLLGFLPLMFFLAQAIHYWQINQLGHMLWMCNIGNLLLALGIFSSKRAGPGCSNLEHARRRCLVSLRCADLGNAIDGKGERR